MNIRPLHDRIVVKRIKEQETTRNGIFIPDSAKEKPQRGEVIAAGSGKRLEDGTIAKLELKPGDLHIMLEGLQHPLKEGEMVPLTLTLANEGDVHVEVMVMGD